MENFMYTEQMKDLIMRTVNWLQMCIRDRYLNDGTKFGFTIGKNLVIDGKQYKIAEDVSEKVGQLLKQYKS